MPHLLDWIGYLASLIILISLMMRSLKRLRWINLAGALLFAVYGFMIGALPVGLMNAAIVLINIGYLAQMTQKKDYFTLLEATQDTEYIRHFMAFHGQNIKSYMTLPETIEASDVIKFFILRNTVPAGLFVGRLIDQATFEVLIDYATPAYRDFKMGHFLFKEQKQVFLDKGVQRLVTRPGHDKHQQYLAKMGFKPIRHEDETWYEYLLR
ncbi:MAG: hypothetical protein EA375_00090 [Acholeplasmataceae bacterium]|nr:MAG: hypothetical protein EA375_00090 [Acholeplasmataceae bacterium]